MGDAEDRDESSQVSQRHPSISALSIVGGGAGAETGFCFDGRAAI